MPRMIRGLGAGRSARASARAPASSPTDASGPANCGRPRAGGPRPRCYPRAVRIAIGSDHAGYELKSAVGKQLDGEGHDVEDVGTNSTESCDYPDFAAAAAEMVAEGEADRAVIVCGSGVGVSIVANKLEGIRAVNAHDADEAEMSRRHNDANVLTLSGARLSPEDAAPIVDRFLTTDFDGGRHARRVDKIAAIERDRDRQARYDDEEE